MSSSVTILSKCTVLPHKKSTLQDLKLSISDLNMICITYIQKGCLFTVPSLPSPTLIPLLTDSLSRALSIFPPLAGRLITDSDGYIHITCNDAGVDFIHAAAAELCISDLLSPLDVPHFLKELYPYHRKISYAAHFSPILGVQVTELADGVFIGCAVSHAAVDGSSFWNFFNAFAEFTRGASSASRVPDFRRESILISNSVPRLPEGELKVASISDKPLRERIFSFSYAAIQKLKARVNNDGDVDGVEISSFQSLCALVWRAVTRARKLPETKTTTFRMAVNIRNRMEPKLNDHYFGNAIQSIATRAASGDVVSRDLRWCAEVLNKNVKVYDSATVRRELENWERDPKCFPMGNHDGATLIMGGSPRLPMYENDFGWGRPVAVRSGGAKIDGKILANPGREGSGAIDLEVVLAPETMAEIEDDPEFMLYVST